MDAHSRVRYMLHKCNRARREHVASNMLFYIWNLLTKDKSVNIYVNIFFVYCAFFAMSFVYIYSKVFFEYAKETNMGGKEEALKKQQKQTQSEWLSKREDYTEEGNKFNVEAYGGQGEAQSLIKRYEQLTTLTDEQKEIIRNNVPEAPKFKVLTKAEYKKKNFIKKWKYNGKVKDYKKARKEYYAKAEKKKEKNSEGVAKFLNLRKKMEKYVDDAKEIEAYQSEEMGGYYKPIEATPEAMMKEYNRMAEDKKYQEIESATAQKEWQIYKNDTDFVESIGQYTDTTRYLGINSTLRKGQVPDENNATGKLIKGIDQGFTKKKLNRDLVVRRGVGKNSFSILGKMLNIQIDGQFSVDALRGEIQKKLDSKQEVIFEDKGYVSTSLPSSTANFPAGGIITPYKAGVELVILVHKGTKAINLSGKSKFSKEQELLLNRGTKFRLVGADMADDHKAICGANGSWTIYLETVPSQEEGIKKEVA